MPLETFYLDIKIYNMEALQRKAELIMEMDINRQMDSELVNVKSFLCIFYSKLQEERAYKYKTQFKQHIKIHSHNISTQIILSFHSPTTKLIGRSF